VPLNFGKLDALEIWSGCVVVTANISPTLDGLKYQKIYFSSGCTQPYPKNWAEGLPLCPSEGTLSRRSRGTP